MRLLMKKEKEGKKENEGKREERELDQKQVQMKKS